ncbi:hypothetical protein AURDEDRAFT_177387 [Auricularia subglabra TFB-10046 SS5]|uniref:Uncharacterized protein n=1 Tax=Auricularia subglabra (strain TFB-10046 / SS5) TaxID=717982 RepID=J0D493_AURST|nr:hypothetical protein AURDEDRAFT_177387 [Auricularia subglabra TFB-10046 SS5]
MRVDAPFLLGCSSDRLHGVSTVISAVSAVSAAPDFQIWDLSQPAAALAVHLLVRNIDVWTKDTFCKRVVAGVEAVARRAQEDKQFKLAVWKRGSVPDDLQVSVFYRPCLHCLVAVLAALSSRSTSSPVLTCRSLPLAHYPTPAQAAPRKYQEELAIDVLDSGEKYKIMARLAQDIEALRQQLLFAFDRTAELTLRQTRPYYTNFKIGFFGFIVNTDPGDNVAKLMNDHVVGAPEYQGSAVQRRGPSS